MLKLKLKFTKVGQRARNRERNRARERERERERETSSHFGSSRPAASLRGALEGGPVSPLLGAAGLPGGRSSERREA